MLWREYLPAPADREDGETTGELSRKRKCRRGSLEGDSRDGTGIETVAQPRVIPLRYLEEQIGKSAAAKFHTQARGIASTEIVPGRDRKSISKETTFEEDGQDHGKLHDVLRRLAAEVAAMARREVLSGSVVTLKVRFAAFETHTRQHELAVPTHD